MGAREKASELLTKASNFKDQKKYDEALKCYFEFLELCKHHASGTSAEASALHHVGNVYRVINNQAKAKEYFQRSLEIRRSLESGSVMEANTLNDLAISCLNIKEFDQALQYHQQALKIRQQKDKDSLDVASSLRNIGVAFNEKGDYDKALQYHQLSIKIFRIKDPLSPDLYKSFNSMGLIYKNKGELDKSLECYHESLKIITSSDLGFEVEVKCLNSIVYIYKEQAKVDLALEYLKKILKIIREKAPRTIDEFNALNSIGIQYKEKGDLDLSMRAHNQALEIIREVEPGCLLEAKVLNNMGINYQHQGNLEKSLECHHAALKIRRDLGADSIEEAASLNNIGIVYEDKDFIDQALEYYQLAWDIHKKKNPGSLQEANVINNIGGIYQNKGMSDKALELYQAAIEIRKKRAPESMDVADSYSNIGSIYEAKKQISKAMEYYQLALKIEMKIAPNSLSLANSLAKIADTYKANGELSKALQSFQDAFNLRLKLGYMVDNHPCLIRNAYEIAEISLKLGDFDEAINYARDAIKRDGSFKYAYNILGQSLMKKGNLVEAKAIFDEALKIDIRYSDVMIHRIELLKMMSDKEGDGAKKSELIRYALNALGETNKIRELDSPYENEKLGGVTKKVELPETEYRIGSKAFLDRTAELEKMFAIQSLDIAQNRRNITENTEEIAEVKSRVDNIEERLEILDGRIYGLEFSMRIFNANIESINLKIAQNQGNQSALDSLLLEKEKVDSKKQSVRDFNKDHDLSDYFHNLLSQITAIYVASQAIASGKVERHSSKVYSRASDFVANIAEVIPVIGNLTSKLISSVGYMADLGRNITDSRNLERLRGLSPTMSDFDEIALRVAIDMTSRNKDKINSMAQQQVPDNWQSFLSSSISTEVQKVLNKYFQDHKSKASLLGRYDAYRVIRYLQQPRVAENLRFEEEQNPGTRRYKKRESVIAEQIVDNVVKIGCQASRQPGTEIQSSLATGETLANDNQSPQNAVAVTSSLPVVHVSNEAGSEMANSSCVCAIM